MLPVLLRGDIVQTLVRVTLHLEILNSCLVGEGELDVELEEHGHQDTNHGIHHEGDLNDYV